jgi:hypothetical protein
MLVKAFPTKNLNSYSLQHPAPQRGQRYSLDLRVPPAARPDLAAAFFLSGHHRANAGLVSAL